MILDYRNDKSVHCTYPGLQAVMIVSGETKGVGRHIYEWPSADEMSGIWDEMVEQVVSGPEEAEGAD